MVRPRIHTLGQELKIANGRSLETDLILSRIESGLFDHLVRTQQHVPRDRQAECLGGLQIDDQLELRRLLNREVQAWRPLEPSESSGSGRCVRMGRSRSERARARQGSSSVWTGAVVGFG